MAKKTVFAGIRVARIANVTRKPLAATAGSSGSVEPLLYATLLGKPAVAPGGAWPPL
jgi:hypothetical protein